MSNILRGANSPNENLKTKQWVSDILFCEAEIENYKSRAKEQSEISS